MARPLLGGTRLLHERFQGHGRQAERIIPHQTRTIRRRGRVVCQRQGCEARAFSLGERAFAEPRYELAAVRERGLARGVGRARRQQREIRIVEAA